MPSPSPRRGLSKLRRNQDSGNDSTKSLAESSTSDEPGPEPSLHTTLSDGTAKLRERLRRKSVDDRRNSGDSGNRLSNLMTRRRSKSKKTASDSLNRELSVDSATGNLSRNHSSTSLGLDDSGRSSLLTDDEAEHDGKPKRPPLSTHASHAGYLTLSAPEIPANPNPVDPAHLASALSTPPLLPKPSTNVPDVIEPYDIEPFPRQPSPERNTSDLLRNAIGLSQRKDSFDADSLASASSSRNNSVDIQERIPSEKAVPPAATQETKTPRRSQIETSVRPATPPSLTATPTTFVTPPTPTDPLADAPTFAPRAFQRSARETSPTRDSVRGRRINIPSKLSQSIPAPLTPTVEETKTPGGTLAQNTNATGFFSSVFTAAQKAADSLSHSIASSPKKVNSPEQARAGGGGEAVHTGDSQRGLEGTGEIKPPAAVHTLGSGDLNFGHLGLAEHSSEPSPMNSSPNLALQNGFSQWDDDTHHKAEEEAAARAVSEAYHEPVEGALSRALNGRPLSIASNERLTLGGEHALPKPGADADSLQSLQRSGSVRSRLSGRRRRRGTSATAGTVGTAGTTNTIAAGISASAGGLGNLSATPAGRRLTGFAVASNKRNKDFHQLFRSVPDDDYLIEDYSAALQRDILLHGRLYVSEGHICFSSNILGWVTNLVISFDEVVSVEKKSTAVIFPNAIVIATSNARNTFASFVARDSTYELLIGIWKISHPNLKSSLNGVTLDNAGTGDKTEVAGPDDGSEDGSGSASDDEVYDEDEEDEDGSFDDAAYSRSIAGSDWGERTISRQPSNAPLPGTSQTNGSVPKPVENADASTATAAGSADSPGPTTHEPTQCSDGAEHYDRPLVDTTIPAPLGKIYSLVFGPASLTFMKKWHIEDQKSRDLNFSDTPLDNEHKTVTFDYIKPLNAPVGPKQTKCITTYNLVAFDLEKAVTVDCSTQTPDVPSGGVFSTKTRYCLMWGPDNSTRMIANCTVEWTGKSWLKGPIETGANNGQIEFTKSLVAALRAAVSTKSPTKVAAAGKKGKRKGKKEVSDGEGASDARNAAAVAAEQKPSDWGLFEPLHTLLRPLIHIFGPFMTAQTVVAVLLALLLYTWFNPPLRSKGLDSRFPAYTSPQRLAAYEELWRREESSLWDWLEDRAGLDGVYGAMGGKTGGDDRRDRQRVLAARDMGKRLDDEGMSERQIDEAIRVTHERLEALREAVARKKERVGKKAR